MTKLSGMTAYGGCAAKFSPKDLAKMLGLVPNPEDPRLLVGFENNDDGSAYLIDDDRALIQTVDVFPPLVDDPYVYGQICATNAISDIYAMGGTPKLALNILCLPEDLDSDTAKAIVRGGSDKAREAGVIISGGHTVKDPVPKYGLAVTGFADPARIFTNANAKPGDKLILTKRLGTGILVSALKAGLLSEDTYSVLIASMCKLNKDASQCALDHGIRCATDITGFGLLGHMNEIALASDCSIRVDSADVPLLPEVMDYAMKGFIPGGTYGNMESLEGRVTFADEVGQQTRDILFDPQTSGGLLIACPEYALEGLLADLSKCIPEAAVVGEVIPKSDYGIVVV